ncbi:hypothetical protein GJ744_000800 [Endocarpon pusillum]|uniref:Vacuolar iron transporter Ccc1 n=1 Tax=Endocarpon pusillum TaxID=364733 RepID=A0A8H7AS46_9EURO|nr:hypothetical protein GJ744_000800 [Endocarpon pusillum]
MTPRSIRQTFLLGENNRSSKQMDSNITMAAFGGISDESISDAGQSHTTQVDLEDQRLSRRFSKQRMPSDSSEDHTSTAFKINRRTISDAILGLSDGLTVPFALSAGLSSLGTTKIVILGGLAELVAGAISMGLGGFLGARSELESYNFTLRNTKLQIEKYPAQTSALVYDIFHAYDLSPSTITSMEKKLQSSPEQLLAFLMDFHHKESFPTLGRAYKTAATLAISYFLGGLIPLIPYFIVARTEVMTALWWSIGVMGITLLVFGYSKTCIVVGWSGWKNVLAGTKGGLQMLLVGAAAAGAAIGLVRAIEQGGIYV